MADPSLKQKLGCWLNERWRTELCLLSDRYASRLPAQWPDLCNRHERVTKTDAGARVCNWTDSSFLTVTRFFPEVGGRLLRSCLREWPLNLVPAAQAANPSANPKISVVIPVGGADRVAIFRCVLAGFLGQTCRDFEIIAVEHGSEPLYRAACPEWVKYVFLAKESGRHFNKSMAMNAGVRLASAPNVLLHDADVIPPAAYLDNILSRLNRGWEAIRPLRFVFLLERDDTESFIKSGGSVLPTRVAFVHQNNPGLSTALSKKSYKRIGGHDERFWGWGGEDLEFLDRLRIARLEPGAYAPALHLWHPPAVKKASGERNDCLLQEIRRVPVHERIEALHETNFSTRY
jgi:N-terminal domain of galactosyltransferase/Glycosyl transferase family 2